ncbi:DNA methyltransferase [Candidatus Spongiihabitans sp.]|uniref:DNA methyltransferase n=1 Tax=Candidatus Spongiihabitans sp. TaxID=3101308 RepID=UPI003C6EF903
MSADEFKDWAWGVWSFPGESGKRIGHEAPFPLELPRRLVKPPSFPGDTALDPFVGSGTTMIASMAHGRVALGIELETKHCRLAINRINQEFGAKLETSSAETAARATLPCWTI